MKSKLRFMLASLVALVLATGTVLPLTTASTPPAEGELLWAMQTASANNIDSYLTPYSKGFVVDANGNYLETGTFTGSFTFGTGEDATTLTSTSDSMFIAKYDSSGSLLWVRQVAGTDAVGSAWGMDLAVDAEGNSLVTGFFKGVVTYGVEGGNQTTLSHFGPEYPRGDGISFAPPSLDVAMFLAKYSPEGSLLWVRTVDNDPGMAATSWSTDVVVDDDGNSLVTGLYQGTIQLGSDERGDGELKRFSSDSDQAIFIAKYNPSGSLLWARQARGDGGEDDQDYKGYVRSQGIAVDADGNSLVTGYFAGQVIFEDAGGTDESEDPGQENIYLNSKPKTSDSPYFSETIFLAKYGPTGSLLWARQAVNQHAGGDGTCGEASNSEGNDWDADSWASDVAVDAEGNSLVTGLYRNAVTFGACTDNQTTLFSSGEYRMFLAKYSPTGSVLWAIQTADAFAVGISVAIDEDGNSLITGLFLGSQPTTFGAGEDSETTLVNGETPTLTLFLAKYTSSGMLRWVKQSSGPGEVIVEHIALDRDGNILVAGLSGGDVTFGEGEDNETILTNPPDDLWLYGRFVAKFAGDPSLDSDLDDDGIANSIDTLPNEASAQFSDGPPDYDGRVAETTAGSTHGRIDDHGGNSVTIEDDPVAGIRLVVGAEGVSDAQLSLCAGQIKVTANRGSDSTLTCGSLRLVVVEGEVKVAMNGLNISVPSSTEVFIDGDGGQVSVSHITGEDPVTVESDGLSITIPTTSEVLIFQNAGGVKVSLVAGEGEVIVTLPDGTAETLTSGGSIESVTMEIQPEEGLRVVYVQGKIETIRSPVITAIIYGTAAGTPSIIVSSVTLGDPNLPGHVVPISSQRHDVNKDGIHDTVLKFNSQQLLKSGAAGASTTTLKLVGQTHEGGKLIATDAFRVTVGR